MNTLTPPHLLPAIAVGLYLVVAFDICYHRHHDRRRADDESRPPGAGKDPGRRR